MSRPSAKEIVAEIFTLFDRYGDESYGEGLSQKEHMIQAAMLAQEENQDPEVVIAALLHDIGHLQGHQLSSQRMGAFGAAEHESIGANYLRQLGFSQRIGALVEGHVLAKRYLCYSNPAYLEALSAASKETLRHQGGPMSAEEAERFRQNPYFGESIRMRYWDEEAKKTALSLPSIRDFESLLLQHLT
ncbi:MAG: HD domain-containing protein [Bacteroidota bacterium]